MAYRCDTCDRIWDDQLAADNDFHCTRRCGGRLVLIEVSLRGYPETFSHCCNEITPPPCGNETRGDRREQVCSA